MAVMLVGTLIYFRLGTARTQVVEEGGV